MKRVVYFLLISFLLASCAEPLLFQQNKDIAELQWPINDQIAFEVDIEDTTAFYEVGLYIRHTDFYAWSNLWVMVYTVFPDGEIKEQRLELKLAESTGKWLGNCTGDLCEYIIPIQAKAYFKQAGTYRFAFEQIMRTDTLTDIASIGLRVKKLEEQE